MMTNVDEQVSQTEHARKRTEKLLLELNQSSDFCRTRDAVMKYISDLDSCPDGDDSPYLLGDADFSHLFVQSLERRGKEPIEEWAPRIIYIAQIEHSAKFKQEIENLRKVQI